MHRKPLKIHDVQWVGAMFLDRSLATFIHEGRYYRAVLPGASPWFAEAKIEPLLRVLANKGFIPPTERCALEVERLGPVFAQRTEYFSVPCANYCPDMLREAALLYCRLNLELGRRGFALHDGHAGNFVLQGTCRPKWCDIGSIIECRDPKALAGIPEFLQCFLYPLLLRQKSAHFAEMLTTLLLNNTGISRGAARELGIYDESLLRGGREQIFERLLDILESLRFNYLHTQWSEYHDGLQGDVARASNRFRVYERVIKSVAPETAIDLGANAGLYSRLLAGIGADVLAVEPDEAAVAKHFAALRKEGDTAAIKLKRGKVSLLTPDRPAKLVLALALTHHLYLSQGWSWKNLARVLAVQTNDSLLTEFMPNGLCMREKPVCLPEDYRLERFVAQLERFFTSVEILEYDCSGPHDSPRTGILCCGKRALPEDDGYGTLPVPERTGA